MKVKLCEADKRFSYYGTSTSLRIVLALVEKRVRDGRGK
jgi:hypothetical protein